MGGQVTLLNNVIYISFFFWEKQTQMGEGWGSKTMNDVLQFHTICRVVLN